MAHDTAPDRLVPGPGTLVRSLPNGEAVLLHAESELYFGLDPVGLRVWELLSEFGSLEPTISQLENEFDVDPATLRTDVEKLVGELLAQRLLVQADG